MLQSITRSTVSKKWQIVLPKKARKILSEVKPGQSAWVKPLDKETLIVSFSNPVREGRGLLKGRTSLTETLLKERREEQAREEEKTKRWIRP
ncbi:MAG: hypothetical protein AAB414_03955 [Patescibacteria group bacterium]